MYKKKEGEFGCYYFHSTNEGRRGKIYDYQKSKEFCANMNGQIPIIKTEEEDKAMLGMLGGYVSITSICMFFLLNDNNFYVTSFRIIVHLFPHYKF